MYFTNKSKELAASAAAQRQTINQKIDEFLLYLVKFKGDSTEHFHYNIEGLERTFEQITDKMRDHNVTLIRKADAEKYSGVTGE